MKRWAKTFVPLGSVVILAAGLTASPSCQPAFATSVQALSLQIAITQGNLGTPSARVAITYGTPYAYTVKVQALDEQGNPDSSFNGYVRFSVEPGTVVSATSTNPKTTTNGRNALLVNGSAEDIQVAVVGSYGNARIWVQDLGYEPVDPAGVTLPGGGVRLPQCADGIDNNHNGLTDYPVDPGCYAPNDDTEDGGTYASASSGLLYFAYPRIADVQGEHNGGAGTPFPNEQVQIDTQWNGMTATTPYGVVVNGIGAQGFYATDVQQGYSWGSVYAYTYSAPAMMNVCDRLMNLGGTAAMFYGYLEINYPTWSLEEWDPTVRPCLVPEPSTISAHMLDGTTNAAQYLIPLEASLVRVPPADGSTVHIASLLGPNMLPCTMNSDGTTASCISPSAITAGATNCDYLGTGKIDFTNPLDYACENACTANVECSEYTQYISESQFQLVVVSADGSMARTISANGAASAGFDPMQHLGEHLKAFTGNLDYFSGGSQFTIIARCSDDIVSSTGTILPSSPPWPTAAGVAPARAACVVLRTVADQTSTN
jgi:hypothetical protein